MPHEAAARHDHCICAAYTSPHLSECLQACPCPRPRCCVARCWASASSRAPRASTGAWLLRYAQPAHHDAEGRTVLLSSSEALSAESKASEVPCIHQELCECGTNPSLAVVRANLGSLPSHCPHSIWSAEDGLYGVLLTVAPIIAGLLWLGCHPHHRRLGGRILHSHRGVLAQQGVLHGRRHRRVDAQRRHPAYDQPDAARGCQQRRSWRSADGVSGLPHLLVGQQRHLCC